MEGMTKNAPATMPPGISVKQPSDVDGQLLGLRPGQKHAVVKGIQETLGAHPFSSFNQLLLHDSNLTCRASEADEAELQPKAQCLHERRVRCIGGVRLRGHLGMISLVIRRWSRSGFHCVFPFPSGDCFSLVSIFGNAPLPLLTVLCSRGEHWQSVLPRKIQQL